ncbi:thioredoxin family protein [bacterium]|nr:thioredoxin family protein [bacterium]PIV81185.1 MAG: thioredoxin [bacterium CG17_big_fil_post_rev_8_21_14_2_50_64_8]PJA75522.1 MAG: thioredoxin [bacterium CG_4_9_14_3_um_filter_65_15]
MAGNRSTLRLVAAVVIVGAAVAAYMLRPAADAETSQADDAPVAQSTALPRLLDLGADKCVPCKMMAPILEELKETYAGSLQVEFIDVWKNPTAAQPYRIRVIPTQIFFSADGTELFRHEGFYSREDILAKWRELGVALPEKDA